MTGPADQSRLGYRVALAHRLSGLALILFLPLHFLTLGLALRGEAALDAALAWTEGPLVKLAEWGLVVLLALHLGLGARVLVLELARWRGSRHGLVGLGVAAAVVVGLAFALRLA